MTTVEKKAANEKKVVNEFCKWYEKQHGVSCKWNCKAQPPWPDAVIRVDEREICIELAQYRELGPRNSLQSKDHALMDAIFDQGQKIKDLPSCVPDLAYRDGGAEQYTIPPKREHERFVSELFDLLRQFGSMVMRTHLKVAFADKTQITDCRRADRERTYVVNQEYPTLSCFCKGIIIHPYPGPGLGLPRSSYAQFSSVDFHSITETVSKKLKKVPSYRRVIDGRPLWLLYYSEGSQPSAQLTGPDYNQRVVQHILKLCEGEREQFDAVWWADCMFAPWEPTVFRVV